jgi:hypothetical protein
MTAVLGVCVSAGATVATVAVLAAGAVAVAGGVGKAETIVTTGCLKAADELGEPTASMHDASGAPYFVLTDTQLALASASASPSGTPSAPASAEAARAAGIEPGARYRIIGLSPRMLRARANTKVEVIGKVEPGKAAAPGGAPAATTPAVTSAPHPAPGDRTAERLANGATVLDGATAIDSLPVINAKSIRTLSPRCGEEERK